jgi:hypothetical protein
MNELNFAPLCGAYLCASVRSEEVQPADRQRRLNIVAYG